ncbi:MAG: GNAT family N-acetyltransferase [Alphaproteobacteria bacterium]|nr:GNAT family N-acetyltransferase [Alphaproteobacteria bacterium]MBO4643237.1 GNAT family N-acetyltransferase [Alphaproteobacteria bacterium]
MLFRNEIFKRDVETIRDILSSTGFFEAAPDEIDVAAELAEQALKEGNSPENYDFVFLEDEGKTVGYACFARVPCTLSSFEIYWIAIHNDCRGKGLGKRLINEVIRMVKNLGATKLVLQTAGRAQYLPTQKFYQACGFKEEARLKNYYAVGDDCLIYTIDF